MIGTALLLALQVQPLMPVDRPEYFPAWTRQLCRVPNPNDHHELVAREAQLAGSANRKSPPASVWGPLGCMRALLAANGATASEGLLMPVGTSWARGSLSTLLLALDAQPGDARSAALIAAFAIDSKTLWISAQNSLFENVAVAVRRAVESGVSLPLVYRACTRLLIAAGDVATARDCSHRAMMAGYDSTWHWLRLSRLAFSAEDSGAGVAAFDRAALAANDSVAVNELLNTFFEKANWKRWLAQPPATRVRWAHDSIFPLQEPGPDSASFASRLAEQFDGLPGDDGRSAYWWCMEEFEEACTGIGVRGETTLWAAGRLHQFWDAATGAPMALVTYGIRIGELETHRTGEFRTLDPAVTIRTWDNTTARWTDTALTPHLTFPAAASKRAFVTGLAVLPVTSGVSSWTLSVRQSESHRGRTFDDQHPPLGDGPLALSDLLLGDEQEGLPWEYGSRSMFVAPLGHVTRSEAVQLYYQLRSDRERPRLRINIIVHRVDPDTTEDGPAMQVGFETKADAGISDRPILLDLARLTPGSYRLEVFAADPATSTIVRRTTTFVVD